MKIHHKIPYSTVKDLGAAYNESFSDIGEDDWLIVQDYDVMPLLPQTISHIHKYVEQNQDAGILTCVTGRISELSKQQLHNGRIIDNSDFTYHEKIAREYEKLLYQTEEIKRDISGFLMIASKRTWNETKFPEGIGCLGVDTRWNRMIRSAGKKIILMKGIYVWHTYRLIQGIGNKEHLRA